MKAKCEAHVVGPNAVVFERTETGYSAYAPDLPGCIAAVDTIQQTADLMREAIQFHIAGIREDGLQIPEPTTTVEEAPRTLSRARFEARRRVLSLAARRRMCHTHQERQ